MNYINSNYKLSKPKARSILICLILFFLVTLLFCKKAFALSTDEGDGRNMVYLQILNYTLPIVKVTSFDPDDLAESSFSLKEEALSMLGVNLSKPLSIVNREISYFVADNNKIVPIDQVIASIDPFNLSGNGVNVNTPSENTNTPPSNTINLPDKKVEVFDPKYAGIINKAKPQVFIYHTHTTEAYGLDKDNTDDASKNVCAVGDAITKELEDKYGISVVHDKTNHNSQAFMQSYSRSGETVDKYLKQFKDFNLIIDLHRDSVPSKQAVTTRMNGENVAKYMFVIGKKNPHYTKNMEIINKMIAISEKLYPGFIRSAKDGKGLYYASAYYNQQKSNNSVLIEVGSEVNTAEEATASGKYLARIIAQALNGKN